MEIEPESRRSRGGLPGAYIASINASGSTPSLQNLTSATTFSQSTASTFSDKLSRKRSRSPAKTIQDLQNATPPTRHFQVQHPGEDLPPCISKLHSSIVRASRRRRGLVPLSIRPLIEPYLESCDKEDDELFHETEDPDAVNMWKDVLRIYNRAMQCFECDKPEASWGEEVVRPLLDLVISAGGSSCKAVAENMTSTNIKPTTLIPSGTGIEGLPYEGKRVDYGLYILPTEIEARKIKDTLKELGSGTEVNSLNQTEAYYLRERPLFTSIELKRARSTHEPLLQLVIWNSALFQRLQDLLGFEIKGSAMLPLPSVTVAGHSWQVCYSYIEDDSTRIMRGMVDIGSTNDVLGIYCIRRVLEVIVQYGVEEYWPWLSANLF